jgi:trk system potassium uptake protein TrkA
MGADLAHRLFKQGHEVVVVDRTPGAFTTLPGDFEGRCVEGDALSRDVLHRAGIEKADAVAVVTESDALNAVVAHVARTMYKIDNVVVRNYEPQCQPMLEAFGFQAVSAAIWGAQRLEELLYRNDIKVVFSAGNGEVEIYEVVIPQALDGTKMADCIQVENLQPVSLTRSGKAVIPSPAMILKAGDIIHVSATFSGITSFHQWLSKVGEA